MRPQAFNKHCLPANTILQLLPAASTWRHSFTALISAAASFSGVGNADMNCVARVIALSPLVLFMKIQTTNRWNYVVVSRCNVMVETHEPDYQHRFPPPAHKWHLRLSEEKKMVAGVVQTLWDNWRIWSPSKCTTLRAP